MTFSLTWLPTVLAAAGLKIQLADGWETRGHGDFGTPMGVLIHHTATTNKTANMPSLQTLIHGRPDLAGPLCNLGLARDGTFYIVAAGKAWHAGMGVWKEIHDGNQNMIGIECENTGVPGDPWPEVQMEALRKGIKALLARMGRSSAYCAGHKEYALPHGRKIDPDFNMTSFRQSLDAA